MGTCCRHEGCIAAMGKLSQAWGLGCCRHVGGGGGGGGGGGELDTLTQMAGGVALSISLRYSCIEYHHPLGLMVSTVTLLHDITEVQRKRYHIHQTLCRC